MPVRMAHEGFQGWPEKLQPDFPSVTRSLPGFHCNYLGGVGGGVEWAFEADRSATRHLFLPALWRAAYFFMRVCFYVPGWPRDLVCAFATEITRRFLPFISEEPRLDSGPGTHLCSNADRSLTSLILASSLTRGGTCRHPGGAQESRWHLWGHRYSGRWLSSPFPKYCVRW